MKAIMEIEKNDIQAVKKIIQDESHNGFVKNRMDIINRPKTTNEDFWHAIIIGILTSHQKSGPDSQVAKILSKKPFQFSISILSSEKHVQSYVLGVLNSYKVIRFTNRISKFVHSNYFTFIHEKEQINEMISSIVNSTEDDRAFFERKFCLFLIDKFKGIGPKQSRNVIQAIGLSKYEIPIDSRFIKWIKRFMNYELPLNSILLSSEDYYSLTLEIIQKMCKNADTIPAIFDACVFSSFDNSKWEEYFKNYENHTAL